MNYADTGFIVSLYLEELTSERARAAMASLKEPLTLTPLLRLEMRNAFNLAVNRRRITAAQCDEHFAAIEEDIANGVFVEVALPGGDLYREAMTLSDRFTPTLLGAKVFYSFDERQRKAAAGEGLKVKP